MAGVWDGVDGMSLVGQARLATRTWGPGTPEIVMLHDGLGSVDQWRRVPAQIAQETGRTVLAYDRPGHGDSTPVPRGRWPIDWMQKQAVALLGLLDVLDIAAPVLVGHSDGASIALIHASMEPERVSGVVALSPHSYVEDRCVEAIALLRRQPRSIVASLARHHAEAAALFDAWSGGWTDPDFAAWDVRVLLSNISCPVLVAQGASDEYATEAMLFETVMAIKGGDQDLAKPSLVDGRLLPELGHMVHRGAPEVVVEMVADFVEGLGQATL